MAAEPILTDHPAPSATPGEAPIDWGVIWVLLAAAFVVILNETVLGVAIAHLMTDFSIDARTAQWLTTGFMLTLSVVIPVTGFVMDRLTTRQVFLTAMTLFMTGTVLAALAPNFSVLLGARVVQASGTAVMMPLLMTTILNLVPMHRRGQTMGLVSIVMSMAPAMGPTISGFVLQVASWRWLFWLVLPIAMAATAYGAVKLRNVSELRRTPLDALSVVLSALGFGGLVYTLSLVGAPAKSMNLMVAGVVALLALLAFVWRQLVLQKSDIALLDLRTFAHRNYSAALGVMMLAFLALMGVALIWPIYLQDVRQLSPSVTGLAMLPGGLAMGLLGPLVGRLFDRYGPRPLVVPAALVLGMMVLAMSRVTPNTTLWMLIGMHAVMSLALSFMFTPSFTTALNALPPRLYSHGSAGLGTLQQVAGAAGAALLVTLFESTANRHIAAGVPELTAQLDGLRIAFTLAAALTVPVLVLAFLMRRQQSEGQQSEGHQPDEGATLLH
ncbi:MDR family MFS transporter [Aestuariimicrobium sp. T2.26MG-19.2B]|uniref:MDR family MFS transporter n=1 Tax=Aestuariimicrobium sp. T2.26MG-19.2B TaxID=3040679 RepID=UPI0024775659|nr:MDR family MFS transporter [Aestuariimicrobium sp. T2.26MG-19.2B]CAI9407359.1 Riboflavin transporter RibZ [Aestuariimicrobium sp. T2.26MG-19.2B]